MSSYSVDVLISEAFRPLRKVQPDVLRQAAMATLKHQRVEEACELVVVLTGDEVLQELNRRHRRVDAPTDVLAFPNETKGPFVDAPGLPRYLGDVIISFPRTMAQAAEAGNELSAELQLLVVHGVLHLLGYDDQWEPARARMWRAQQAVLDELGIEVHIPD
ncbi:MAG: rRNA maturation RNase YbeY [Anaerolineae bacterium]|jgi:probable rRNA maturation factor